MAISELAVGFIFLSQTVIGVLGNFSFLYHYLFFYLLGFRLRSTDVILIHLTVANILTLLCKGVPQTISAFGSKDFLNDIGCKLVFSFHRVGRGVGIGSTSFLSVFQATSIGLRNSRYSDLKLKTHKCICYSVYLSWILHFLISSVNFIHMRAKYRNESTTNLKSFLYCYWDCRDKTRDMLYAALLSIPDIIFLGLMVWASSYMVLILYRHKQKMQQMPRNKVSSKSSESRATKTILLLVSTFVSFYTFSSLCQLFGALLYKPSWSLVNVTAMASLFFPVVCPFLLMSRDSRVSSLCLLSARNRVFPRGPDDELN
ncbi:vomeronasal type-1 receptor 4-like [Meriones unguiculatus]|uniref:vomeronasal type-1 receptor 4-like n=1 Tax=Meriones unguiculatus TaxID=10047 RepID=UPI000B4F607F|nr:vomeronasal type-1 receptor 4-like [Meriones unguiculatus]